MLFALPFPAIDPVLISFGPFVIHWYALAYIGGLLLGWRYMRALAAKAPTVGKPEDIDDFLVWATLGVVLGGRLGYILFYRPGYYLANPLEILAVWQGGMSFHGGILGVTVAGILFVRRRGIAIRRSPTGWRARRRSACCSAASPISSTASCGSRGGRFLGGGLSRARRCPGTQASFTRPRWKARCCSRSLRPSAAGRRAARPGVLTGVFVAGYALARMTGEMFREPDAILVFCRSAPHGDNGFRCRCWRSGWF